MNAKRHREIGARLFKKIRPLLPPVTASPRGGRPRVSDEKVLNGLLHVVLCDISWQELPQELGFGCGMTCWRRLRQWQDADAWPAVQRILLDELHQALARDLQSRFARIGASALAAVADPAAPPEAGDDEDAKPLTGMPLPPDPAAWAPQAAYGWGASEQPRAATCESNSQIS
jgi:transposase